MSDDETIEVRRITEVRTLFSNSDPDLVVLRIKAGGVSTDYCLTVAELAFLAEDFAKSARSTKN